MESKDKTKIKDEKKIIIIIITKGRREKKKKKVQTYHAEGMPTDIGTWTNAGHG